MDMFVALSCLNCTSTVIAIIMFVLALSVEVERYETTRKSM